MSIARELAIRASRRRIWALLCALLFVLTVATPTLGAAQLTATFVGLDPLRHQFVRFTRPDGRVVNDLAGVILLRLDKNSKGDQQGPLLSVFCIELFVTVGTHPFPTETYFSNGSVNALPRGPYMRYLLAKYPATTIAANDTAEAAARQLALWHFSDQLDLTTVQNAPIRARAIALANEAQTWIDINGPLPTLGEAATISIAPTSATVLPGQPASYTVSVTPPTATYVVNLSVDGTARFDNGQQQATIALNQGAATFNVTNPNVASATITAVLPFLLDAGTVFDSARNPPTQRLVLGDQVTLSATATLQTSLQAASPTPSPTATPSGSTSTPTAAIGTPGTPAITPGGPTSTPGGPSTTPGVATGTPGSSTGTPGLATSTPGQPANTPTRKPSGSSPERSPTPATAQTPGTQTAETPQAGTPGTPVSTGETGSTPGVETSTPGPSQGGATPDTSTPGQVSGNAPRPRSLPRTAAAAASPWQVVLLIALVLVASGAIIRRRGGYYL